jgi:hypothetical protein
MGSAQSFHPAMLDRLIRLRRYGRDYLTDDEYRHHASAQERQYRRMLADAWLRRREPEFWDYHRRGLATIGEEIRTEDLVRNAVPVLVRRALEAPGALLRAARKSRPHR